MGAYGKRGLCASGALPVPPLFLLAPGSIREGRPILDRAGVSSNWQASYPISLLEFILHLIPRLFQQLITPEELYICLHHLVDHFLQGVARFPAQLFASLGGITDEQVHLGGAIVLGVDSEDGGAGLQLMAAGIR